MATQVGEFVLLQRLNVGTTSTVYRASPPAAAKIVSAARVSPAVVREVAILARLDHPNIVRVLRVAPVPVAGPAAATAAAPAAAADSKDKDKTRTAAVAALAIVTELLPRGDLFDALARQQQQQSHRRHPQHRGFAPEYVRRVVADIAAALQYLAQEGVVHADIKLENVALAADGTAKLIDFGSCREETGADSSSPSNARSLVGTAQYLAPELLVARPTSDDDLSDIPSSSSSSSSSSTSSSCSLTMPTSKSPCSKAPQPTFATDAWAFGVMIHTMLTATYPFDADAEPPSSSASSSCSSSSSSPSSSCLNVSVAVANQTSATSSVDTPCPDLESPLSADFARHAILHCEPSPLEPSTPADLKKIISGLLCKNPADRMTMRDVCAIADQWTPEMLGNARASQRRPEPRVLRSPVSAVYVHGSDRNETTALSSSRQSVEEMVFIANAIRLQRPFARAHSHDQLLWDSRPALAFE
jgi:serine/threonine protein kinase